MQIHPYDRSMAFTSIYIIIPAMLCENPLFLAMILQTFFSILHWVNYNSYILHAIDVSLSSIIFIWHIVLLFYIQLLHKIYAFNFCILALITFYYRRGIRKRALKKYNIIYLLPHALFRFFSFWFVMFVHQQKWSYDLTLIYWWSVIILGLPIKNIN